MGTNIVAESVQQFNLKWTNYTNNLLEIFADQFNKGFLTDVCLCCDGTLIKAHKMVLAACSSYFERLFEIYNESNPLIILNGVQLKDLKALIQFMYRGEIKVHENDVSSILKLSKELQVKGLKDLKPTTDSNLNFDTVNEGQHEYNDTKKKNSEKTPNTSENLQKASPVLNCVRPKAFMIFANKMRRKLINEHPNEQPKEISVRLGVLWETLPLHTKRRYFAMARKSSESGIPYTANGLAEVEQTNIAKRPKNNDTTFNISDDTTVDLSISSTGEDDDIDDVELMNASTESISSEEAEMS